MKIETHMRALHDLLVATPIPGVSAEYGSVVVKLTDKTTGALLAKVTATTAGNKWYPQLHGYKILAYRFKKQPTKWMRLTNVLDNEHSYGFRNVKSADAAYALLVQFCQPLTAVDLVDARTKREEVDARTAASHRKYQMRTHSEEAFELLAEMAAALPEWSALAKRANALLDKVKQV